MDDLLHFGPTEPLSGYHPDYDRTVEVSDQDGFPLCRLYHSKARSGAFNRRSAQWVLHADDANSFFHLNGPVVGGLRKVKTILLNRAEVLSRGRPA